MTTEFNRKTIAQFLDRAAARADMVNRDPASAKQCWFLAGLIAQHKDDAAYGEIVTNTSFVLTKQRASQLIDTYLN